MTKSLNPGRVARLARVPLRSDPLNESPVAGPDRVERSCGSDLSRSDCSRSPTGTGHSDLRSQIGPVSTGKAVRVARLAPEKRKVTPEKRPILTISLLEPYLIWPARQNETEYQPFSYEYVTQTAQRLSKVPMAVTKVPMGFILSALTN